MTTTPLPHIPVRSADELTQRWATLLAPPVFGLRSLWVTWLDTGGLMNPVVVPIDGLPMTPNDALLDGLLHLHDTVVESSDCADGHLAMALCRPGTPLITAGDDDWTEALREHLDARTDGTWSLHLAAGGTITRLVPPPAWPWRVQAG